MVSVYCAETLATWLIRICVRRGPKRMSCGEWVTLFSGKLSCYSVDGLADATSGTCTFALGLASQADIPAGFALSYDKLSAVWVQGLSSW